MAKVELLAPAGSERAAQAAVQSGADAVYIGGQQFSARKSADNFTLEQIRDLTAYCHLRGVAVHVAVNTLVKEKEADKFLAYIQELNSIGVDALIIQDIGMASKVRAMCPDLPLHASTQMTAASLHAVKFLERAGFSRVVLARELSREQIREIKKYAKAELEVFCHGALCMCFSGQCLFSSMIGGRSGNRGMCAQPCRLAYTLTHNDKQKASGFLLSPKDMALVEHLAELQEIGIDSLKIEGRLKRAEYVSAVVGIYRKYMDNAEPVAQADMQELKNAFCRSGFTDSYWQGKTGGQMMSFQNPGNMAENLFTEAVKQRCAENANFRRVRINIAASLRLGGVLDITVTDQNGNQARATGEIPAEYAVNKPLDKERLCAQLSKLGGTVFVAERIDIELQEGLSIPVSEINHVRRSACMALEKLRTSQPVRRWVPFSAEQRENRPQRGIPFLTVQAETEEQICAALECGIERIYIPARLYATYKNCGAEIVARLPAVCREGDRLVEAERVLVSNIGQIQAYRDRIMYGGFRLNIYNSASCDVYQGLEMVTLSPELNLGELQDIVSPVRKELVVYGRLPLMIMQNCPIRATGRFCQNGRQEFALKDRKNEVFPVLCGEGCIATLCNAKPLYMADKLRDVLELGPDSLRLIFTIETRQETKKIISAYQRAAAGGKERALPENTFTRGHFYRGVQ